MKTRVLDYPGLLALLGTSRRVSLAEIADFLVTSPDYARKAVATLRADGYAIEKQYGVGYRRDRANDTPIIKRRERKLRRLERAA